MPETKPGAGPIPYIDIVVAGLGQINVAVPVIVAGVSALYQLWKSRQSDDTFEAWAVTHPNGTLAEWQAEMFYKFVTTLRTEAGQVIAEGEAWLHEKGYTRDAFGNLIPPPA
jgi:hypothetical protein